MATQSEQPVTLSGLPLLLAALGLGLSNFMVVLDTTIANVSVPHISGAIGVAPIRMAKEMAAVSSAPTMAMMPGNAISRRPSCMPDLRKSGIFSVGTCIAISPVCVMVESHLCNALWRLCNKPARDQNLSSPVFNRSNRLQTDAATAWTPCRR